MRTTETMVTFRHPFALAVAATQPAGTYRLVTEEEEIPGLSFVAFRRTAMMLHLPALSSASATHQVVPVDALEWTALVAADGEPDGPYRHPERSEGSHAGRKRR